MVELFAFKEILFLKFFRRMRTSFSDRQFREIAPTSPNANLTHSANLDSLRCKFYFNCLLRTHKNGFTPPPVVKFLLKFYLFFRRKWKCLELPKFRILDLVVVVVRVIRGSQFDVKNVFTATFDKSVFSNFESEEKMRTF